MCGIVGYVGRAEAGPILLDGLRRLEYRGYDSCASTVDASGKKARLFDAVRTGLRQVIGTYGIALVHADVPDFMIGARRGSPLVLGVGNGENFLASDVSAIVAYTRDAVYLNDFDVVAAGTDKFEIISLAGDSTEHPVSKVEFTAEDVRKGDYPHYMLKEICEQPNTVRDAMRGRLNQEECTARLGGLNMTAPQLRDVGRIVLTGCGTALHAGRVGEYLIERLANIPTEVDYGSEFRHRNTPMTSETLVFAISQSGETADTLGALRKSPRKRFRTLGICNNVASTIARESDGGVYMHAGPEIGLAATKSFTSQLAILTLLGLLFGRMRNLAATDGSRVIEALEALPGQFEAVLELSDQIKAIARKYAGSNGMLFFGRQFNFPVALEGALKMKEITYLFAEGHPSAELKHGIIALIRPDLPSVFIAPDDSVFSKNLNNIEQVKARKGPIIAVTSVNGAKHLNEVANEIIVLPEAPEYVMPILSVVPLQLLAYHLAVQLGRDVDKPRNLAKSVTVE